MKKLLPFVLLATIATAGTLAVKAEESPLATNVRQQAAAYSAYDNNRVENLCDNWPGCAQWAASSVGQDSSFRIIDAEIEYWIAGWGKKGAVWFQNLYLQTLENGQKLAYEFRKNMNGYETLPYQINKFPGHPPVAPAVKTNSALEKCKAFPNCAKWYNSHRHRKRHPVLDNAAIVQFITRFDTKGNAVWNRDLYVWATFNGWDGKQHLLFHAYQKEAGSPWTYETNPRSF